jgi:shikimate dehydrogenase
LSGLNVTIPHKEAIIPYLDALDDIAQSTGAVNVIKITREGGKIQTKGFNTDCPGFLRTLGNQVPHGPALILGTGGAAKAVSLALQEINVPFSFVSRRNKGHNIIAYEDLTFDLIKRHLLIINATPLGMYPNTSNFPPFPYQYLSEEHFLYDLIYNPGETEFLKRGIAMNTQTMNGMQMFLRQAELSSQIFLENI